MPTSGYQAAIDANDVVMSYGKETAWGTKPSVQFQDIRYDKEGFSGSKSRKRPEEIDPSRQASAAITTKFETQGSLDFSVSAGTHNDLIASSIGGTFTPPIAFASKTTVAATATGFTDSGSGFVTAGIVLGQMIKVTGFSTASINGIYLVTAVAAGTITTSPAPPATKTAGDSVTFKGSMCRNGASFDSFYFQKRLASDKFLCFPGSWPNSGQIEVAVDDYFKSQLTFLCKSQVKAITDQSTGAHLAANTNKVIDSVNGISGVYRNGSVMSSIIQKFGVKWSKDGAAAQFGIGSTDAQGLRLGKLSVTGNLSSYFKDFTLYDEFINESSSSIWIPFVDATGTGYCVTICNATIMNPKIIAGGSGSDVMADFDLEGNPDTSGIYGGKTIQIDYFN